MTETSAPQTSQPIPTPTVTHTNASSPNTFKMLSIGLICLFIGVGAGIYLAKNQVNPFSMFEPKGCTMEAKICPDGSAVGRMGPKCEFAPCHTGTPSARIKPPTTEDWKPYTVQTDNALGLTDYMVMVPPTWVRVEHSSNFQNTETFTSDVQKPIYTLTITQEPNKNPTTGKPYTSLRELTGLSYDVDTVTIDGLGAARVLPRAGSEHINKVVFFSADKNVMLSIELQTPQDGSLAREGEAFFSQILSSFKFITSPTDAFYFSKRLVDTTKFFTEKISFPIEMMSLSDADLVGLSCSKHYDGDNTGKFFAYTESSSQIPMTDTVLLQVAKDKPTASALMQCTTQKGQTIVLYENFSGGGGSNNVSHFALRSSAGTLTDIAQITNDGAPYFTCNRPYMLTGNNIFYWGCGGGDGGFGQSSIYAIDLTNKTVRRVLKCTSTADSSIDNPVGTSTTKCE